MPRSYDLWPGPPRRRIDLAAAMIRTAATRLDCCRCRATRRARHGFMPATGFEIIRQDAPAMIAQTGYPIPLDIRFSWRLGVSVVQRLVVLPTASGTKADARGVIGSDRPRTT